MRFKTRTAFETLLVPMRHGAHGRPPSHRGRGGRCSCRYPGNSPALMREPCPFGHEEWQEVVQLLPQQDVAQQIVARGRQALPIHHQARAAVPQSDGWWCSRSLRPARLLGPSSCRTACGQAQAPAGAVDAIEAEPVEQAGSWRCCRSGRSLASPKFSNREGEARLQLLRIPRLPAFLLLRRSTCCSRVKPPCLTPSNSVRGSGP